MQGSGEHILRAGSMFDHAAFGGKVAFQDGNAAIRALSIVKAVDDVFAGNMDAEVCGLFFQNLIAVLIEPVVFQLFQIFTQRLARDG